MPFAHTHKHNEEVYIVLGGCGMLFIDKDEFEVKAGDIIVINPNGERCFKLVMRVS